MKFKYLPDGSFISYRGSLKHDQILLVIGRDNLDKDTLLLKEFIAKIPSEQYAIVWYEPVYKHSLFFLFPWLFPWRGLSSNRLKRSQTISERCERLKQFLKQFEPHQKIMCVTQSAGGRIASLISDESNIERLICFGYPFKHPEKPPEPERYLHLETLKTPFLIFQGVRDDYGSQEAVTSTYKLSSSITLEFMDTDHDFHLSKIEKEEMLSKAKRFLNVV